MSQHSITPDKETFEEVASEYSKDAERPLGGYLVLMSTFVSIFLGFLLLVRVSDKKLPAQVSVPDLLLLGVATHHFGRILSKAGVTSPLRAPFTEYEGQSDPPAEVKESVRKGPMRHAIGELVTCPFCLGLWVAAFFSYGLVVAPRVTRLAGSIFVIDAISDNLNLLYDATANITVRTPDLLKRKTEDVSTDRHGE